MLPAALLVKMVCILRLDCSVAPQVRIGISTQDWITLCVGIQPTGNWLPQPVKWVAWTGYYLSLGLGVPTGAQHRNGGRQQHRT